MKPASARCACYASLLRRLAARFSTSRAQVASACGLAASDQAERSFSVARIRSGGVLVRRSSAGFGGLGIGVDVATLTRYDVATLTRNRGDNNGRNGG